MMYGTPFQESIVRVLEICVRHTDFLNLRLPLPSFLISFEPISQSEFLLQVNLKGLYLFQALVQTGEDSLLGEVLSDFDCGRLERSPPLPVLFWSFDG